jgi:hypothetical protein
MNVTIKRLVVVVCAFALIAVPCASGLAAGMPPDEEIQAGQMAGDALFARPLGICATVIGGALFVISLPFSALGGNTQPAFERLVADPFEFTFDRPLGEF